MAAETTVGSRYGRLLVALAPLIGLLLVIGIFALMSDAPDQYLSVRNLRIAAVLAFLTAASFAYAASLSSSLDRAYYNTFSRASEILVGILAAFLVSQFDRDRADGTRHAVDALGIAAILGMAWLWSSIDLHDPFVFRGGTLLNSLFTCIVIVACLQPGLVARGLTFTPIRRFGSISYGVYLVHWPIFLILDENRLGLGHNKTFVVRVLATLTVAIAMYFLFENPIRRGKLLRGRAFFVAVAIGTVAVIGLALALPDDDPNVLDLSTASPVSGQLTALKDTPTVAGDPANLSAAIRGEVLSIDKEQPISSIKPLAELVSAAIAQQRFAMTLLGTFAAVALLLATVGIYGVMSYSVTQRTHEIGIRMALGASSRDVLRLVVGHGLRLTLLGVALGVGAAFLLSGILSALLFGVSATDLTIFGAFSAALTVVSLVACLVPARRATHHIRTVRRASASD